MELAEPQDGVARPLLLREAEQGLDLRADVDVVQAALDGGEEHHGRDLLHEGAVARLDQPQLAARAIGGRADGWQRARLRGDGAGRLSRADGPASGGEESERLLRGSPVRPAGARRSWLPGRPQAAARRACSRSQPYQPPARRRGWRRGGRPATPGSPGGRSSTNRSTSKATWGSRSILLSSTSSAARNMCGYLTRLVVAFGDRRDHHPGVLAEVEQGRADEVADVLDDQHRAGGGGELVERRGPPSRRRGGSRCRC